METEVLQLRDKLETAHDNFLKEQDKGLGLEAGGWWVRGHGWVLRVGREAWRLPYRNRMPRGAGRQPCTSQERMLCETEGGWG